MNRVGKERRNNLNKHQLKNDENKFEKENKIKSKKFKRIKIVLIILLILIVFTAIKTGIFIANWQSLAQDMISNTPSQVLDIQGNVIAEFGTNKNTKNVSFNEMPDNLKNAYVAIEDQRFYKHSGVDFPRTAAAIFSYIRNLGSSSFGGSSITQQLVKNLTGDNSSKVSRKINEWIKAFAIEGVLDKDEILEAYLNIIYVGPNLYGVEMGSNYYFNKSVSELDLAECAFLAGINNSPNSYNPFDDEKDNSEKIKTRTKTVLAKMLELEYINEEDYNQAILKVENGLKFKQGKIQNSEENIIYSYHTDALLTEIIEEISKKKNISTNFAENYIEMAGLKIYSTQDSEIQSEIEKEFSKNKYILKSENDSSVTSQAAMVVMDHKTGYVVGCVGGLGEKSTSRGFNRATQALRQTGSAGKPLAVLVPGLEEKIFTPATLYLDEETTFDDGTETGYSPTDYNDYRGIITVRQAVESSQNIPFVKMMEEITPKTSIKYMEKMGITTLTKTDENLNLALGGLDKGISPLEMAAAYSCIANDGIYIEPTFYIKIENSAGKTVLKTKQKKKRSISKEVAYIVQSLLTEPVIGSKGTANYCKIPGIDVAAKTGTTNDEYDRWLCGFTPYYTAVTWFGFDLNETIKFNGKNPSGQIWSAVMKSIHSNLDNAKFDMPKSGIETATICPSSGLFAFSECPGAYTEYFIKGTSPTEYCNEHSGGINIKNSNSEQTETQDTTQIPNQEPETSSVINEEPQKESQNENIPSENSSNEENILNTPDSSKNNSDELPNANTVTDDSNISNDNNSQEQENLENENTSSETPEESTDDTFEQ